jgi:hypothetical protein
MGALRIGVKFCGNCNPHVDTAEVPRSLASLDPDLAFVSWDQGGYEVLLVLCGCPAGCAKPPAFGGPMVFVTSRAIDHWPVDRPEWVERIAAALKG